VGLTGVVLGVAAVAVGPQPLPGDAGGTAGEGYTSRGQD
jgi:hypothetical protein